MPPPRRRPSQKRYRLGRRRRRDQEDDKPAADDRLRGLDVGIRRASRRILPTNEQVAVARRFVRTTLGTDHPYLDDAQLLTSELVTAAVTHTDADTAHVALVLRVQCTTTWGRIELVDAAEARVPALLRAATHHVGDGGIALVDRVAGRWGVTRAPEGTELWFETGDQPIEE